MDQYQTVFLLMLGAFLAQMLSRAMPTLMWLRHEDLISAETVEKKRKGIRWVSSAPTAAFITMVLLIFAILSNEATIIGGQAVLAFLNGFMAGHIPGVFLGIAEAATQVSPVTLRQQGSKASAYVVDGPVRKTGLFRIALALGSVALVGGVQLLTG